MMMANHSTQSSPQNRQAISPNRQRVYVQHPSIQTSQAASYNAATGGPSRAQNYGSSFKQEKTYQASEPVLSVQPNKYKQSNHMYTNQSLPSHPSRQQQGCNSEISEISTLTSPVASPSPTSKSQAYSSNTVFGELGMYASGNVTTPQYDGYGFYNHPAAEYSNQYQALTPNVYPYNNGYNMPYYQSSQPYSNYAPYHQLNPYPMPAQANANIAQYGTGTPRSSADTTAYQNTFENFPSPAHDEWKRAPLKKYSPKEDFQTKLKAPAANHLTLNPKNDHIKSVTSTADETSVSEVVEQRLYLGEGAASSKPAADAVTGMNRNSATGNSFTDTATGGNSATANRFKNMGNLLRDVERWTANYTQLPDKKTSSQTAAVNEKSSQQLRQQPEVGRSSKDFADTTPTASGLQIQPLNSKTTEKVGLLQIQNLNCLLLFIQDCCTCRSASTELNMRCHC